MQTPNKETDKCACCGCDTGIPKDTPISNRKYYIQGSGQLCDKCYMETNVIWNCIFINPRMKTPFLSMR